jgi:hypothetical protein
MPSEPFLDDAAALERSRSDSVDPVTTAWRASENYFRRGYRQTPLLIAIIWYADSPGSVFP